MKNDPAAGFNGSSKEIANIIARYRASGLGLKAFARKEGLPPGRLHYWIYQKPGGAWAPGPAKPTRAAVAPVFQEVQLHSGPEWGYRWAAEVGLPGGLAVRFSTSASAQWISSVVQALQRPC
jgi:hypothetical protein